jgi:ceramide glucosyltransferase
MALTFGLEWSVLAAVVAPSVAIGASYLAAYLLLRYAMAWTVGVWGIGDPITQRSLWLVPVRDVLNICVWIAGLFSNTISWRGSMFRVKQGLLIPIPEPATQRVVQIVVDPPTPSWEMRTSSEPD